MIFLDLFWTFFFFFLFTFGGGYAMLPLIQAAVEEKGWLTEEALVNFVAVSESTPGPFAVNISTYIGSVKAGIPGAACATLGVALPSFIVILLVARFYARFKENRVVSGVMTGLKPAVIGLIGAAILNMGRTVFFSGGLSAAVLLTPAFLISLGIFIVMAVLAFKKVHPILLIAISAAVGIAVGYLVL